MATSLSHEPDNTNSEPLSCSPLDRLDACERLQAIDACDELIFQQFFEVQRGDKNRRWATYTGNASSIRVKTKRVKRPKYLDLLARVVSLSKDLKDQRPPIADVIHLAIQERQEKLPISGEGASSPELRIEKIRLIREFERVRVSDKRSISGSAAPSRSSGLLVKGSRFRDPYDLVPGFFGTVPIVPLPPGAKPSDQPIWAIGITYRQRWCGLGYARGRLVRSIPLTPNETLDIVTKTWNRRTERREVVQAIENDVSTEYVGDEKWSLATRKELTATLNGNVNGNATEHFDVSLPLKVVDVSAGSNVGIGGNLGGSLSKTIEETTEHITQETIKAANRLKTTVTSTVEIATEIGNEVTRTQKISNPNRCNSISYHFFEITERYRVSTKAMSAAPYLLIPLDRPAITYDWVLCHECELKAMLPCAIYYEGFAAAKLLRAREQLGQFLGSLDSPAISDAATSLVALLEQLVETYYTLSNGGLLPGGGSGDDMVGAIADAGNAVWDAAQDLANDLGKVADAIADEGEKLWDSLENMATNTGNAVGGFLGGVFSRAPIGSASFAIIAQEGGGGPGSFIYWEILKNVAPELEAALTALAEQYETIESLPDGPEKTRAVFDALNTFFARVGDVQAAISKIDAVAAAYTFTGGAAAVAIELGVLGLPGAVLAALLTLAALAFARLADDEFEIADLLPDDEGLKSLILRARGQVQNLGSLGLLPVEPGPDASKEDRARYGRALQELKREQLEAALASVEFQRLKCHLEDNFEYYNQSMWHLKSQSKIQELLERYHIPLNFVDQSIVAFVRNRAAFRVDVAQLTQEITGTFDWKEQVKKLDLEKLFTGPPTEECFDMPTAGMVVEPSIGQCPACDDFIMKHRNLDVLAREAEVKRLAAEAVQAELEASRLDERIKTKLLEDPTPFEHADRIQVNVAAEPPKGT